MKEHRFSKVLMIILFSVGLYQIIAAGIGFFLWVATGDWRPFIPQIMLIAFWINWPFTYWIVKRYQQIKHISK